MIYFTSDLHYAHKNLCKGVSKWANKKSCRDFKSLSEMNDTIVKSINDTVDSNDILYCLGDWSFGGVETISKFRALINCKDVRLILGNHDDRIRENDNLQKIFTHVKNYDMITINKQCLILSHFPLEYWRDAENGSYMLYGHLHGLKAKSDANLGIKRLDVGWDVFKKPISIIEIQEILNSRPINLAHH